MHHRSVTGVVIGRKPAEEGGVEADRHEDQVGDVSVLKLPVADDDRDLEIPEGAGAVHFADVKDQLVVEQALTPPQLHEFMAGARRRSVHGREQLHGSG